MSDGLLDTRGERARAFGERLLYALLPSALLVVLILATGGGIVAVFVGSFAALIALSIATSVRSARGALVAGTVVAAVILLAQIALGWFTTHPILPE